MSLSNQSPSAVKSAGYWPRLSSVWFPTAAWRNFVSTLPRQVGVALAPALPSCLALAAVAICTWVSFRFGQGFAFTGFIYLAFVVLAAMYGGFWQATLISVVAAGCLNYFFVPPIFSFVNSAENWVALGAFELTALVISRLSHRVHLRAMEVERLYETSRQILLLEPFDEAGSRIASLIREMFELQAVQLFDALSDVLYRSGDGPEDAGEQVRHAYSLGADSFDPFTRSWYCVLRAGGRPVGALALSGTVMSKLAATALGSLSGIALERVRVLQKASRAEADRQTEQLRTSVLDDLAHQFKTPLAVARTASSGLLALGGLSALQAEFVTAIDQQARKLDELASRLLGAARLDRAEFTPRLEPLLFSRLLGAALQRLDLEADRGRFHVSIPSREVPIFADRELVLTSVAQLVDNAVRYSEPGSPIDIGFQVQDREVVLRVRSRGLVVAPADRERVFERFYRAPETRHLPAGNGLGLSIVKKIVEAHHGHVWAEGEKGYGTLFSMALPAVQAS